MSKNKIVGSQINKASIRKKIANSRKYKQITDEVAQKHFERAKRELIKDFERHPVTLEISAGEGGGNISGALGGYGNLFTFIGFPKGSDPTEMVRSFLISAVRMKRASRRGSLNVNYNVEIPSLKEFGFAKMPWEGGNNWIEGIESGISGFNYFMSKASQASRSGSGIQIDNKLRSITKSTGTRYITEILNNFKKRIAKR